MNTEHSQYIAEVAAAHYRDMTDRLSEPCAIYRPKLSIDGNQWCALYGENLQDGVAGFGASPELAMLDFNQAWWRKLPGSEAGVAK